MTVQRGLTPPASSRQARRFAEAVERAGGYRLTGFCNGRRLRELELPTDEGPLRTCGCSQTDRVKVPLKTPDPRTDKPEPTINRQVVVCMNCDAAYRFANFN